MSGARLTSADRKKLRHAMRSAPEGWLEVSDIEAAVEQIATAHAQAATTDLAARVEAAIRLAQPDHLTPMGARQIRKALNP